MKFIRSSRLIWPSVQAWRATAGGRPTREGVLDQPHYRVTLNGNEDFRARDGAGASAHVDRISKRRVDKFDERRGQLAEAALKTLSEIGYARTSLREIANNSNFSHGVLHYYFTDKVDLIVCSVRQYKAQCVTRYDRIIATSSRFEDLEEGFLKALGDTVRDEAHIHRLWYDLRSQALFEEAFRADVAEIDDSLRNMISRITARFRKLAQAPQTISDGELYPMYDGLFQQCLLKHLSGDTQAISRMQSGVRVLLRLSMGMPAAALAA